MTDETSRLARLETKMDIVVAEVGELKNAATSNHEEMMHSFDVHSQRMLQCEGIHSDHQARLRQLEDSDTRQWGAIDNAHGSIRWIIGVGVTAILAAAGWVLHLLSRIR